MIQDVHILAVVMTGGVTINNTVFYGNLLSQGS